MHDHDIISMTHEIRTLSGSTLARLCGSPKYSVIDLYVQGWVQWVLAHDLRKRWKCWQECHKEYLSAQ